MKSRCGRHRKLTNRDARVLTCYVRDGKRQPLSKLSSLLNVSRDTTWSYLHDLGFKNYIAPQKPYLSEIGLNLPVLMKVGVLKIGAM